jgi:flagellar biosynthesis protein FliR
MVLPVGARNLNSSPVCIVNLAKVGYRSIDTSHIQFFFHYSHASQPFIGLEIHHVRKASFRSAQFFTKCISIAIGFGLISSCISIMNVQQPILNGER